MAITRRFLERVREYHDHIAGEEAGRIAAAARLIADCIARGGLLRVIGPGGHSMLAAEECVYRAGGLVPIDAILDNGIGVSIRKLPSSRAPRRCSTTCARSRRRRSPGSS